MFWVHFNLKLVLIYENIFDRCKIYLIIKKLFYFDRCRVASYYFDRYG